MSANTMTVRFGFTFRKYFHHQQLTVYFLQNQHLHEDTFPTFVVCNPRCRQERHAMPAGKFMPSGLWTTEESWFNSQSALVVFSTAWGSPSWCWEQTGWHANIITSTQYGSDKCVELYLHCAIRLQGMVLNRYKDSNFNPLNAGLNSIFV